MVNHIKRNKATPYKLRFSTIQELRQGGSLSIERETGKNGQPDCTTFSFVDMHRHTPSKNQMPCNAVADY